MPRERGVSQRLLTPDVWPVVPSVLGMLVGLGLMLGVDWRLGLIVFGAAVGLAAVVRLVLPQRAAGLLVVRSRGFDVVVMGLLGAAIIAVALLR